MNHKYLERLNTILASSSLAKAEPDFTQYMIGLVARDIAASDEAARPRPFVFTKIDGGYEVGCEGSTKPIWNDSTAFAACHELVSHPGQRISIRGRFSSSDVARKYLTGFRSNSMLDQISAVDRKLALHLSDRITVYKDGYAVYLPFPSDPKITCSVTVPRPSAPHFIGLMYASRTLLTEDYCNAETYSTISEGAERPA